MKIHRTLSRPRVLRAVLVVAAGLAMPASAATHQDGAAPSAAQPATPTMQQGQQLVQQGQIKEAIPVFRAITEAQPNNGGAWFFLGYALHADGQLDEAIEMHKKAATYPQVAGTSLYNLGCAHALQGDSDAAFVALRRAIDTGMPNPPQWGADTDLDSLRDDPRWQQLMDRNSFSGGFTKALRFWVGDWECYSASSGQINGRNTLALRVGGNVIHESWTPEGGGPPGESWNWFDPIDGMWHQLWVDGGQGTPTHYAGVPFGSGVLFTSVPSDPDAAVLHRMHVRPIENGRVQQTGSESNDGGETWQPKYDLIYVPKGEPLEGEPDASET